MFPLPDDKETLSILPRTMKSDLVVHDIVVTLSKVRIFQVIASVNLHALYINAVEQPFLPISNYLHVHSGNVLQASLREIEDECMHDVTVCYSVYTTNLLT